MKLKYVVFVITFPLVVMGPVLIGYFAFQMLEVNSYEKLSVINDIYTENFVNRQIRARHQILQKNQLDDIDNYVEEYKKEAILEISKHLDKYQGTFIIIDDKRDLLFFNQQYFEFKLTENALKRALEYKSELDVLRILNKNYVYSTYSFDEWSWTVLGVYPTNKMQVLLRDMAMTVTLVCIAILLLSFVVTVSLSQKLVIKPLVKIADFANKIANLELDTSVKITGPAEIKKLGSDLNSMRYKLLLNLERLEAANEELSQFSYRTSHDLRAPLISIRRLGEAILEDIDEQNFSEASNNTKKVIFQASRLDFLVSDILELTKADMSDIQLEQVVLDQMVKEVVTKLELVFPNTGIEFSYQIEPNLTLQTSRPRLYQVMENLISNAIKYRDTKRHSTINITACLEPRQCVIQVKDNGVGIDSKYWNRLFTMFQRFRPDLAHGSGLGLYIIKKHLDKMGASLGFQSNHQGTLFTIILPQTTKELS